MDWKIEQGISIRENGSVLSIAEEMEQDDSIGGLDKKNAGRLARALEETYGPRTATVKARDGAFRVWRVAQRPENKRATRKADAK